MSNYDLGTATGKIEITYKDDGTKKAISDIDKVGDSAKKSTVSTKNLGTGMGVAGAIIVGGLGIAVNAAADFEKGLSAIQAVSGATTAQMEKIRAKALEIGKDTKFGASDASKAIEELSKAGVSTTDILNGAADATVALAAAGEVDLPFAATIASNAMNQFSLKAKDLPHVADLIAGAANASAIDVKQFGYSLSQVGAVANLAGLSFGDTTVAIAELGNAGIVGSDAGTSLKTALTRLQPSTAKTTELFKELGLITKDGSNAFYDQTGKLKPLRDIQQTLQDSLKGMTQEQKQATLQTLFGSDAIRGASILAGQGAAGYDKLNKAINATKAADVAATRMNNLKGSVEQLKGSAETLEIQLGTILLPTIRKIVDGANALLGKFLELTPQQQKLIVQIAAAAGGFLLFGAAIIKTVAFVTKLVEAFKLIGTLARLGPIFTALRTVVLFTASAFRTLTVAMLSNPIGIIILAIIALVVIIVVLYKNSETFRNIVQAVWAAIQTAVGAVVAWFTDTALPTIQHVWDSIAAGAQNLWSVITTVWTAISTTVSTAISTVVTVVTTVITALYATWSAIWGLFGPLVQAVFNLIVVLIEIPLAIILVAVTQFLNGLFIVWSAVWNAVKAVITAVWGFIGPYIITALNAIKTGITTALTAIQAAMTAAWGFIKAAASAAWILIKSYIVTPVHSAYTTVAGVMSSIKSAISSAWTFIKSATSSAWNSFYNSVKGPIDKAMALVRTIRSKVEGALSGAGSWLVNAGRQIIQGLINGINAMVASLRNKLNSITNLLPSWKGPPQRDKVILEQSGELVMQGFINGIVNQLGPLRGVLLGVTNGLPDTFASGAVANAATSSTVNAPAAVAGGGALIHQIINNPVAEPTSVTTTKALTKLAQLGVLG